MLFTRPQRETLLEYTAQLNNYFGAWLYSPIQATIGSVMPREIIEIRDGIGGLLNGLQHEPQSDFVLMPHMMPSAKLAIQIARRSVAEKQEVLRDVAVSAGVHRNIDELMAPIREFQDSEWFQQTDMLKLPALTDFLTLQAAYDALRTQMGSKPKVEFDGKFGILQSNATFLEHLKYSRVEAAFRNIDITVAFADIDKFKVFNDEFTETVVDREILRPVMRLIESHCYSRGDAFMFGGDEYVLLLPNSDKTFSRDFLFRLQEKLADLSFSITDAKVSISIGCCTIHADSTLTNQEVLDLATSAKAFAKSNGRDCIAVYQSDNYSSDSLICLSRRDIALRQKH